MGAGAAIAAAVEGLCARLTAAGVPAFTAPGRVERGGAWVSAREARLVTMADGWEVIAWVWLVASDTDTDAAIEQLTATLDKALTVVDLADDEPIDLASSLALPNSPTTRLPAYRLVVTIDTESEEL